MRLDRATGLRVARRWAAMPNMLRWRRGRCCRCPNALVDDRGGGDPGDACSPCGRTCSSAPMPPRATPCWSMAAPAGSARWRSRSATIFGLTGDGDWRDRTRSAPAASGTRRGACDQLQKRGFRGAGGKEITGNARVAPRCSTWSVEIMCARNLQCLADDGRHVSIAVQGGADGDDPDLRGDAPPPDADRIDAAPARRRVQERWSPTNSTAPYGRMSRRGG